MLKAWHLHQAVQILKRGGLVAYPTEAVYGIGCIPTNEAAVKRLLKLKRRPVGKGLILVAASVQQIQPYIDLTRLHNWQSIQATWPGPVTWLVPASRYVPNWIRGQFDTIAVRVSTHPVVRTLCHSVGPLVSTSANPSGQEPARTAAKVRCYFSNNLDFIVPGATGGLSSPTEIRDALTGRVLRKGPSIAGA